MVHGKRKELGLVIVKLLHVEATLHQLQVALNSNGIGASNLVCCNVVSAALGL
jgi:hypothetical protein